MTTIRRALVSVSDRTGLVEFAQGLVGRGVELVATSGTANALAAAGIAATRVEDITGIGELVGGRVKTLHPAVHAGILARADSPSDQEDLSRVGAAPFDLVVVNLYPFARLAARRGTTEAELIEAIDIGGPSMLRAAAKNFERVVVICQPERYRFVLAELEGNEGAISAGTRRDLAAEAFAHSAGYDAAVANWFAEDEQFPDRLFLELVKDRPLRYGENPHQRAALYSERGARRHALSRVVQHGGNELSYNNIADISAGRRLLSEFTLPACTIIKHTNPCGVAIASRIDDAYMRALASDPEAAFGGVVLVNRPVSSALAEHLAEIFLEAVFAPAYEPGVIDRLGERLSLRILENKERRQNNPGERHFSRVIGGMLVQDVDSESEDRESMTVVSERAPTAAEWQDILFSWRVVKHVTSNAIVATADLATVGIGGGQVSRVDAVKVAVQKARGRTPIVIASDAFFPFADAVEAALAAGATAIVQPGGAKRDAEVVAAVNAAGAAMVFSGRRHFRH